MHFNALPPVQLASGVNLSDVEFSGPSLRVAQHDEECVFSPVRTSNMVPELFLFALHFDSFLPLRFVRALGSHDSVSFLQFRVRVSFTWARTGLSINRGASRARLWSRSTWIRFCKLFCTRNCVVAFVTQMNWLYPERCRVFVETLVQLAR